MKNIKSIIIRESIGINLSSDLFLEEPLYDLEIIIQPEEGEQIRKNLGILTYDSKKYFDGVLNIGEILFNNLTHDVHIGNVHIAQAVSIGLVQCEYKHQKHIKEIYASIHPVFKIAKMRIFSGESVSDITVIGNNVIENLNLDTKGKLNKIHISGVQDIKISGNGNFSNEVNLTDLKEDQVINILGLNIGKLSVINIDTNIPEYKSIKQFKLSESITDEINFQGRSFSKIRMADMNLSGVIISGGFIGYIDIEKFYLSTSIISDIHLSEIVFPENQEKFTILDSVIQKNIFSNIIWNNFLSEFDGNHKISNGGLKETYRMIKYQYDEIGNKTEANKFFAKEMEYHMEVLKEDPTKKWEYVVAKIQKEVSDFGNDWMKAMTIYFIVCLLGFGIAQFFDAFNNWIIGAKHLFQCWDIVWSEFIRYLNPLPKIDEVPGLWYLLVSVIKLLIVYQIVVALRRISQR